jgi:Mg-chelatase subunit ChlD
MLRGCASFLVFLIATISSQSLHAQFGTSGMSMGELRAGLKPPARLIRVEELINYHRHVLPKPTADHGVELSVKSFRLASGHRVVQAGISTTSVTSREQAPPLNLVLVIDCSGSMSGSRIERVKLGLLSLVDQLRPVDKVAIVVFSTDADLILPTCARSNQKEICEAISRLRADGSTNLYAGLMLGYRTAKKAYDPKRSNRVILLTDGIANVGTVDPESISHASKEYNDKQIDLSTIGVGDNFNRELLRQLSDAGRGLAQFVDDAADLNRVFVEEANSLLTPVARDVRLLVSGPSGCPSARLFGYKPSFKPDQIEVPLGNLNADATQVVLFEFKSGVDLAELTFAIEFSEGMSGRERCLKRTVVEVDESESDSLSDATSGLKKNYAIAMLSQAIKDAAEVEEIGESNKSQKKLKKSIKEAKAMAPSSEDKDLLRIVAIAEGLRG